MWDERYSEDGWAFGTEPNDFLRENASALPQGRILCLADGEGRNSVYIAGMDQRQVHAVDLAQAGLDKAQILAGKKGVKITTEMADLNEYGCGSGDWGGIVSIFVHLPGPQRRILHRKVLEGLQSGGVFLLEAYTPDQLSTAGKGGPPDKSRLAFLDELLDELKGLNIEIARETRRDVNEGKYHQGPAAVVQILGRK